MRTDITRETEKMKHRVACLVAAVLAGMAVYPDVCSAFTTEALEEAGFTFTGYFEPLIEYIDNDDGDTSNLKISSLELGLDYTPNDWLLFHALYHWEDGADGVTFHQGYLTVGGTEAMPVVIKFGRFYLPLGGYSSLFCGDPLCTGPLTKTLTETKEDVLQASYDFGVASVQVGTGNGRTDEVGEDDSISLYYGHFEVLPVKNVVLGASYTSDLADTDAVGGIMPEEGTVGEVPGYSLYALYASGRFYGRLGYSAATKQFDPADLDGNGDGIGDEPSAWALIVAYDVTPDVQVGALYSQGDDFDSFAEELYGAVVNYTVYKGILFSIEVVHSEFADGTNQNQYVGRAKISF